MSGSTHDVNNEEIFSDFIMVVRQDYMRIHNELDGLRDAPNGVYI
jgi:hypothetical protein